MNPWDYLTGREEEVERLDHLFHRRAGVPRGLYLKEEPVKKEVEPIRPTTPSGKTMKMSTVWACYVNLCSALGMPRVPPTPKLAAETGLQMKSIQEQQNKALEVLQRENDRLKRQVNYFSGRSFVKRIAGVFVRPKYPEEKKPV